MNKVAAEPTQPLQSPASSPPPVRPPPHLPGSSLRTSRPPPSTPASSDDPDILLSTILSDVQSVVDNSVLSLAGIDDIDHLEQRLAELGPATDAQAAVVKEVFRRRKERILAEKESKERKAARLEGKRGAAHGGGSNKVLENVVRAGERAEEEYQKRHLGVDPEDWLDWDVSIQQSLVITASCIAKMLGLVVLFSLIAWITVLAVKSAVEDGEEGNKSLILTITGMSSLAILLMMAFIQCFVGMTHVRSYLLLVVPVMLVGTVTVLYFEVGGETSMDSQVSCAISPYPNPLRPELNLIIKVAATAASVTVGITIGVLGFSFVTECNDINGSRDPLMLASQRAVHSLAGRGELEVNSVARRFVIGVVMAIPTFFNLGVMMLLAVGIFALFRVSNNTWWKLFVTALALGIKIGGNKLMLGMMGRLAP